MKLSRKKLLAARTFGVGKERIIFHPKHLEEIADAITRRDFFDLLQSKAVLIKESIGRKKKINPGRKGAGKTKKKLRERKRTYIILTRKLRKYLKELRKQGKIPKEVYLKTRNQIRARIFKSKSHLQSVLKK